MQNTSRNTASKDSSLPTYFNYFKAFVVAVVYNWIKNNMSFGFLIYWKYQLIHLGEST